MAEITEPVNWSAVCSFAIEQKMVEIAAEKKDMTHVFKAKPNRRDIFAAAAFGSLLSRGMRVELAGDICWGHADEALTPIEEKS